MKKFKFGLEGLLKIREFREKRLQVELGDIVSEMEGIKQEIAAIGRDIVLYYRQQEQVFDGTIEAREIQQFPRFIRGLKAKRAELEKAMGQAQERYRAKMREMAQAMADTQLVEGLKGKKHSEFLKQEEKLEQQDIEEMYNMRKRFESS